MFKLLQSLPLAINSKIAISSSKISAQNSASIPINPSQQCIWCDNFDHYYSACQEFHQALQCDHISLSKSRRILSIRSGKKLPLAIGRDEMKPHLWYIHAIKWIGFEQWTINNGQRTTDNGQRTTDNQQTMGYSTITPDKILASKLRVHISHEKFDDIMMMSCHVINSRAKIESMCYYFAL